MNKLDSKQCPCDSGKLAQVCCGPVLAGSEAPTAEALMRSRYVAYTQCDEHYLLYSWHPRTRPPQIVFDGNLKWLGLKILRVEAGDVGDDCGIVEFVARYKLDGRGYRLHETSRFERIEGRWVYVIGES